MGGDTGKIIGYVALAAAVVVATGPAGAGWWGAGETAATGAGLGGTGAGLGGGGFTSAGVPTSMGFGTGGLGATGSALTPGVSSLGSLSTGFGGATAGMGTFGAGTAGVSSLGSLAPSASYIPASATSLGGAGTAVSSLGSVAPAASTVVNPGILSRMGTAVMDNPFASYMIGSGVLNQAMAQYPEDVPMMDFSSVQQAQTYDQTLGHMTIEQLTAEMQKPNLSQEQRNAISRAMSSQGLSDDRIYEARLRGELGAERSASVNEAVQNFYDATNVSQEDLDAQTALLYASYKARTDSEYDDAQKDTKQVLAQLGRLASAGGNDQFGQLAQSRVETDLRSRQQAEAEVLRRNAELANTRQMGVNAILAGANYGDVQDRWDANFNEQNRRYQLADLNSQRDQNYSTQLLGLQGANQYNTAKYAADTKKAQTQALQGLEMTKLGMRGFGDLVPSDTRYIYDSYDIPTLIS